MIITSSHMMITVIMTITWTLVHGRQAGDNWWLSYDDHQIVTSSYNGHNILIWRSPELWYTVGRLVIIPSGSYCLSPATAHCTAPCNTLCSVHCTIQYTVNTLLKYTCTPYCTASCIAVFSDYYTALYTVLQCALIDWCAGKIWYRKKVSRLVSEKFCTVKSLWTSIKNKTSIVKTWYQTKVSEPVLIFFYRQKSTSIGIKNIYYQRKKKYWYQYRLKLWVQSHSAVHCSANCSALFTAIVYYIEY